MSNSDKDHPDINPGDWIQVENVDCVVTTIYKRSDPSTVCEIVCNPQKPANRDVTWDDGEWRFVDSGDFGGYAEKYPRLSQFVRKLKDGKYT